MKRNRAQRMSRKKEEPRRMAHEFCPSPKDPDQKLRIRTKSPRERWGTIQNTAESKSIKCNPWVPGINYSLFPRVHCFLSLSFTTAKIDSSSKLHRFVLIPSRKTMRVGGWTLTLFWLKVPTPQNNFMFIAYWFYVGLFCVISLECFVLP